MHMGAECAWDGGLDQSSEVIPGVRAFTDLIQTHKRLKRTLFIRTNK